MRVRRTLDGGKDVSYDGRGDTEGRTDDKRRTQDKRRALQWRRVTLNNHWAYDKRRTKHINQSPADTCYSSKPPPHPHAPEAGVLCSPLFHSSPGRTRVPPAAGQLPATYTQRVIHEPQCPARGA